jgi:WD40 repeat protein
LATLVAGAVAETLTAIAPTNTPTPTETEIPTETASPTETRRPHTPTPTETPDLLATEQAIQTTIDAAVEATLTAVGGGIVVVEPATPTSTTIAISATLTMTATGAISDVSPTPTEITLVITTPTPTETLTATIPLTATATMSVTPEISGSTTPTTSTPALVTPEQLTFVVAGLSKAERTASSEVAFRPDGKLLAIATTLGVWLYPLENPGDAHWIATDQPVLTLSWSPDGTWLATGAGDFYGQGRGDHTVQVWDVATGELRYRLEGHTSDILSVRWSPDGTQIASAGADNSVRLWEAASGALLHTFADLPGPVWGISWSPNSQQLAAVTGAAEGTAHYWLIWQLANRGEPTVQEKGKVAWWTIDWSPDGKQLATGANDQRVQVWRTRDGDLQFKLSGHAAPIWSVAWSPDGRLLASAAGDLSDKQSGGNEVRLWQVGDEHAVQTFADLPAAVVSVSWSRQGGQLAAVSPDGTVYVWRLAATP